jgi:hypothetical protein
MAWGADVDADTQRVLRGGLCCSSLLLYVPSAAILGAVLLRRLCWLCILVALPASSVHVFMTKTCVPLSQPVY